MKLSSVTAVIGALFLATSGAALPASDDASNCTTPIHENHFMNPLFETSNGSQIPPWFLQGMYKIIPNPVGQGNAVQFKANLSDNSGGFDRIAQGDLNICPGESYVISLQYMVEQLTPTPKAFENNTKKVLDVNFGMGDMIFNSQYKLDDDQLNKWRTVHASFAGADNVIFALQTTISMIRPESKGPQVFWHVTLANPLLTRLPHGIIPSTGPELVENGGFESGQLSPWTYALSTGYDYYYAPPPGGPCEPGEDIFNITSPGLPATKFAPKSNFKADFCTKATGYTYYPTSGVNFLLMQGKITTEVDQPYVLSVEFYRGPRVEEFLFQFGDIGLQTSPTTSGYEPHHPHLKTYQRIVTGTGERAELLLRFFAFKVGLVKLRIMLDNISLRALDKKSLGIGN